MRGDKQSKTDRQHVMPARDAKAPSIHLRAPWQVDAREVTDESHYRGRRAFLKQVGKATAGGAALLGPFSAAVLTACNGCQTLGGASSPGPSAGSSSAASRVAPIEQLAVTRNPAYTVDRPLTPEQVAASYNNYYEFTTDKEDVARLAAKFPTRPWTISVEGECHRPTEFDIDDLMRTMPMEERVYRFRCVEAWAMTVPWIGFPLSALLKRVEPKSSARFVRIVSFNRPLDAVGQKSQPWYPWPYHEGLTIEEATNELTMLATGIYGHTLPNQHGAPIRLVVPWKYGFKNIKGIVKIELTERRPPTFWNTLQPREYDFMGNVNPEVPHPRWSQASERMIGSGERRPTLLYNGYADQVAHLYKSG